MFDSIRILIEDRGYNNIPTVTVTFRSVSSGQYWGEEFAVRDRTGNPTEIGRKMGIRTQDKRISMYSPRGMRVLEYLHRLAGKYAGSLTNGKMKARDDTMFAKPSVLEAA
jgi:hypothetical protein